MQKVFQNKKTMLVLIMILLIPLMLFFLGALSTYLINLTVKSTASKHILKPEEVSFTDADCILVLGCLVWSEGAPATCLKTGC